MKTLGAWRKRNKKNRQLHYWPQSQLPASSIRLKNSCSLLYWTKSVKYNSSDIFSISRDGFARSSIESIRVHLLSPVYNTNMRWIYSLLYSLAMLVALPYFLLTGLVRGKYLRSAGERFGFISQRSNKASCWVHCVSVGEFLAAQPLIRRIQSEFPYVPLFLSTTTITGQRLARNLMPESSFYFPFDWGWCIRRVLRRLRPGLVIVLETEIWPNFLWECDRAGIPTVLVNGRISRSSFQRYMHVRNWLPKFRENLMQTESDRERMLQLGASPERTFVMGNLKFEFHPPVLTPEFRETLRGWKGNNLLWIAGSTMRGEEALLLKCFHALREKYPLKLMIAPRHPDRFVEVALLASRSGLPVSRRSLNPLAESQVLILDTIGELAACYELGDVVFIGGTLRDFGGHNPIEPAFFGKAIVAGPYDSNFRAMFEEFRAKEAICVTDNLEASMNQLLADSEYRSMLGMRARELVVANSGAGEFAMERLRPYLRSPELAAVGEG